MHSKFILLTASVLCLASCMGTDEAELAGKFLPPIVSIEKPVISSESIGVTLNGSYKQNSQSAVIDEVGFYYGDNSDLTSAEKLVAGFNGDIFSIQVTPDAYDKDFYIWAYLSNGKSEIISDVTSFRVPKFEYFVTLHDPVVESSTGSNLSFASEF